MKTLALIILVTFPLLSLAQSQDSVKTQHIKEVVVTAQNHVAIKDGVSYTLTPRRAPVFL